MSTELAPPTGKLLRVHTYSGIGDVSWIYSKLVTLNRPIDLIYYVSGDAASLPIGNRAIPLFQMLPAITNYRVSTLVSRIARAHNPVSKTAIDNTDDIYCVANFHLEAGNRIEEFIPDVDIDHHYPINISEEDKHSADVVTQGLPDYCLLYTSSISGNAHWGGWGAAQWADLVAQYRMLIDNKPVILVGAEWDQDIAAQLQIPGMRNLVNQTSLGTTLELIRRSTHFLSFPSGLAVMACQLNKPVLMLHPKPLRGMHYTWAPMDMIADHSYIPTQWGRPYDIMERVADYWDSSGVILRNIKVTTSCRPIKLS